MGTGRRCDGRRLHGGLHSEPHLRGGGTGQTGHAETVRVLYSPAVLPTERLLQAFFESHDPTSLNRQGGDVGTQYRSAVFPTTAAQESLAREMIKTYQKVLTEGGYGDIVTEIVPAPAAGAFYPAEDYHQQYLAKNPGGYQCHARTGMTCPLPQSGPLRPGPADDSPSRAATTPDLHLRLIRPLQLARLEVPLDVAFLTGDLRVRLGDGTGGAASGACGIDSARMSMRRST